MRSFLFALASAALASAAEPPAITWQRTTIDPKFHAEGVAVADVNKDGKLDVLIGEYWYEAPDWKAHEMQKPGDYGDGLKGYSKTFCCWTEDLNADGWIDLIVVDFPGAPCYWLENPKGADTHWKRHTIWHSACNETPQYADLFGTGKRVLIMGFQPKDKKVDNEGRMAYFTPNAKDSTAVWEMHPISAAPMPGKGSAGTARFSHGLGIGDVNSDKRMDVITLGGWWEQPEKADGASPWKFHPGGVSDASADIFAFDVDNDGVNDLISTSAHKNGIWWWKQRAGATKDANPEFTKNVIFPDLVSETHAAHFVDIDGDGQKDLVTGKRWWSHGRSEPGSDKPSAIYWLKVTRDKDGMAKFTPNLIDDGSGIGTQFEVVDINKDGLLDIVTANKRGVHIVLQKR